MQTQQTLIAYTSTPTIILTPARENTDGVPQGDMRIREIGLDSFSFKITNDEAYTVNAMAHWLAIGY